VSVVVRKKICNPDWEQSLAFDLGGAGKLQGQLHVELVDWNKCTHHKTIGGFDVPAEQLQQILEPSAQAVSTHTFRMAPRRIGSELVTDWQALDEPLHVVEDEKNHLGSPKPPLGKQRNRSLPANDFRPVRLHVLRCSPGWTIQMCWIEQWSCNSVNSAGSREADAH
jgi:hypothetical protein